MPLTIDTSQFGAAIKRLAGMPKSTRRRAFGNFASYMEDQLNRRAPWKTSGNRAFRGSYNADQAVIGTPTVWARIRHYGGTIRASGSWLYRAPAPPLQSRKGSVSEVTGKKIKYLAIPIQAEKDKRPRDYKGYGSFVMKSKKGNLLIAQRADAATGKFHRRNGASMAASLIKPVGKKAKGKIRILFVLKKSVTIKPTRYADIQPHDRLAFADAMVEAMGETVGKS